MKEKKDYRYSLFSRFVSIVILVFIILTYSISWKIQEWDRQAVNYNLISITKSINNILRNNLCYYEDQLLLTADQIAEESDKTTFLDKNIIIPLLKSTINRQNSKKNSKLLSIGFFNNNQLIQYNDSGILKKIPINTNNNSIIKDLSRNPFKVLFNLENSISLNINNNKTLPLVMGITNKKNVFVGSLIGEISLEKIRSRINQYLENSDKKIYYAVIFSPNNKELIKSSNFKDEDFIFREISNYIDKNIQHNVSYISKSKNFVISRVPDFPFILAMGSYSAIANIDNYIYSILPYKYELLGLLSIIGILIYLFYNSILKPFLLLSKAALDISKGNINTQIPRIYSKEGSAVAKALEKIKTSLKIEKNLVQEITQTKNTLSLTNIRLEKKVQERTKELENALTEKTSFLNNLSHEVKMPLQGLSTISGSLVSLWSKISDKKRIEFAYQISNSSQALLTLFENLLELAKFSESKVILSLESTNLLNLITETVEECKLLYLYNKKININIMNDKPIYASLDKNRIKQVLRNLLVNAIKFTPSEGHISIKMILTKVTLIDETRQEAIQVIIHDQGVGIPEEELSNIFSPFAQGSNAKNKSSGTGLGLTICRDIINTHHGKIWAENNKDGGATFNFIIPLQQTNTLITYNPGAINLNDVEPNILVVDDEQICLNSIEMMLYGTRYNLIKMNSANNALKYLKEFGNRISIIFIDLMMPDMYGLNFMAEIKNDPILSSIPIILQTSSSDEDELIKAFDLGILSLIRKPYRKKALLDEIEKAMHLNKINQSNAVIHGNIMH